MLHATTHAAGAPHEELPEVRRHAEEELTPDELRTALHRGHEAGGRAARRQGTRWILGLALVAFAVALAVDWRFAFVAVVLALFYAVPYVVASAEDSGEEAERDSLEESLREHERHVAHATEHRR